MAWLLNSPQPYVATKTPPTDTPQPQPCPTDQTKKRKERADKATEDLKISPESKYDIAAHYKLSRGTICNQHYGRTQATRAAHPEELVLTSDQEESVERWVENPLVIPQSIKSWLEWLSRCQIPMQRGKGTIGWKTTTQHASEATTRGCEAVVEENRLSEKPTAAV